MSTSSYVELLKAGKLPRSTLFLLAGSDASVHLDVVSRLVRGLVKEPDLNYRHMRAADSLKFEDIEASAEDYPMMSRFRLLWIDGVDKLAAPVRQALAAYLPRRPETTVLVLSSGAAPETRRPTGGRKSDSGPTPEEVAAEAGLVVLCDIRLPDAFGRGTDDRPAWIALEFDKRGLSAAPPARQALLQRLYGTHAEMRGELDKLHAYVGDRKEVTRADVELIVTRSAVGSLQQMSALLQRRDAEGTLRLYRELVLGGVAPFQVLGYVGAIMRKTATVPELQRLTEAEVMAKGGVSPDLAVELLLLQWCRTYPSVEPPLLRPRR